MRRIVIVGRPNVGKSTLFNRIAGRRRALIHDMPGMTRDRISEIAKLGDGRTFELIDTGGLEYGDDPLSAFAGEIREQARRAIETADAILFVVDGEAGLLPEDEDIARDLRVVSEKVVVVVNKIDTRIARESEGEFHVLGFDAVLSVSAEHGVNMEELYDEIGARLPDAPEEAEEDDENRPVRLAIIGRPNVGKSSLLNRLVGSERSVVSEIAGTTRDAVDEMIEREGKRYLLIDTAGIRRKGKTTEQAEKLAVMSSLRAMARAEVALVMIEAVEGVTAQDATVAGYAEKEGLSALVLVNKWDLVEAEQDSSRKFEDTIRMKMKFLQYAPIEFISAKSGRRVEKLFDQIDRIAASHRGRFKTSQLNEILERALAKHQPPAVNGKARRFYYATQLKAGPPTIALFSNVAEPLHFSYKRYLENQFRDELGLYGTPVHLVIRGRKGMKEDK
ncbi:MAG TPA: ribosome biogenesis GTPase Der [Thermoanaerobaculia bacterium]|nr:ribosome biogenesis GTPase Der [Thermoanaerobaculia bacterium]